MAPRRSGSTSTTQAASQAFGFYGVDIGDFNGNVTVTLTDMFDVDTLYVIPHTTGTGIGGSVLYWGIVDTDSPFKRATFGNTASGTDLFAFDDMTIGSVEQVGVPEPGTMALLGLGLLGVARKVRNRRKQQS